jgi:O-antigen/teichoic acid export membrane protein
MTERDESRIADEKLHLLIRGGTRAAVASQIASQAASLVVLAILYRLLRPEDYGLFGMALPAVMLPRMAATLGVGAAIVQAPQLSAGQRTSLFWLLQGLGLAAALVTAACGALLARAYQQPLVMWLSLALAGSTLLATLGQTHQSLLERQLAFVPLSMARLVAQVAGGIAAIGAAWRGWGVWSLVIQQTVEVALAASLAWRIEPWRPARPARGERLGALVSFSGYFAATNLVFYVAQNLEKLLFPWLLGSSAQVAIGLFSQAMSFVLRIVYLATAALSGVMLPALSRAKDNPLLYAELVTRFFRLTGIVLLPAGVGLFFVAPEVMLLLGGDNWRQAGTVLRSLAPLLLAQGLLNLTGSIFGSLGQGRRLLAGSVVYAAVLALGLVAGWLAATKFPPATPAAAGQRAALWMAAGYTLVTLIVIFVPYLAFCLRSAGVSLPASLLPLLPALRGALLMGICVWLADQVLRLATGVGDLTRLAVLIVLGVASYFLFARREVGWLASELFAAREPTVED